MSIFTKVDDFMGGMYLIEFGSGENADEFIDRYQGCPVWPIITKGAQENQVLIVAIELKAQRHGDFTQENNTLVKSPHYLGAKRILFKRDDSIVGFLNDHQIQTGYASEIPCGSNCEKCPSYQNPCQGCPAYYKYRVE